jgi:hypothetical protein
METLEAKVGGLDKRFEGLDKQTDDIHLQINRPEDEFDSYFMWASDWF